jgi:hypothetical protein
VCIILLALGWGLRRDADKYFGEGKPGTLLSVGFLFAAAGVCASHYRGWPREATLRRFWLGMSIVLAVAAIDDLSKLHERLDPIINRALGVHPKGRIADRLDDVLVMAYALPAVALAFLHRNELLRQRWMVLTLAASFVCFLTMSVFDLLHTGNALEDCFKLVAGALIVCALLSAQPEERPARSASA